MVSSTARQSRVPRLRSLDVARGLALVVNIASPAALAAPLWWRHAPWAGVHGSDLIFPVFVTLTGAGLGLAYRRGVRWHPALRRALVLVLVGLAYNAYRGYLDGTVTGWSDLRWTGVLQFYAVLVLVVAFARRLTRREGWFAWAALTGLAAFAHTVLLAWSVRDCPAGMPTPDCNPSAWLDPLWLSGGAHMYAGGARGHDPEGLVAMAGGCVSVFAGAATGRLLIDAAERGRRVVVVRMSGLAGALGAGAVRAAQFVPPMKRLWTAPFSLGVAAGVAVLLVLLFLALDRPDGPGERPAVLTAPLLALGRNSLLVYFGSMALTGTLLSRHPAGSAESWAEVIAEGLRVGETGPAGFVLASILAWTSLAVTLDRRGIYLRP